MTLSLNTAKISPYRGKIAGLDNGVRYIIEQETGRGGSVLVEQEPEATLIAPPSRRTGLAGWLDKTRSPFFGWTLGLLGLGAYLAWLALPSRLPALGLAALLVAGALLRWYSARWAAVAIRSEYIGLGLILLAGAALRMAALRQSLPYFDNPDEPTLTAAALRMLQTGDFNPHFFRWPSLPFYLQAIVSVPQFLSGVSNGSYTGLKNLPLDGFMLAGRTLVAVLGTATVGLTYLLGRSLYGGATGLLAALIMAVLPLHTEHSKYITPDVIVAFLATLTLLMAAYVFKSGRQGWYLWAGVAAGLTTGAKYNAGIVLLVVVLAHFLTPALRRGRVSWLVQSAGLAVLSFVATTPFLLFDLTGFLNELAFQVRHYTILGHGSASEGSSWSAYLRDFWSEAFTYQASLVALGGVGLALVRQRRQDWLVVALPLAGYFLFSSARVHFARNLMPLLPPLAVLGAVFLLAVADGLLRWPPLRGWPPAAPARFRFGLVLALWLGFFWFCLLHSVLTNRYYLQPDTRQQAAAWIVANLPTGSRLRLEQNTPILPPDRYRNATEQRPIGGHPPEWYRQQGFDYLVASSTQYLELSRSDPEAAANYKRIFEQFELVSEFAGDSPDFPGPTIRIYKVK